MKFFFTALSLIVTSTLFAQVNIDTDCVRIKAKSVKRMETKHYGTRSTIKEDFKYVFYISTQPYGTVDHSPDAFTIQIGSPSLEENLSKQQEAASEKVRTLNNLYMTMAASSPETLVIVPRTKACFDALNGSVTVLSPNSSKPKVKEEDKLQNEQLVKEIAGLKQELELAKSNIKSLHESNARLVAELSAKGKSFDRILEDNTACQNDKANILATCMSISTEGSKRELKQNIEAVRKALVSPQ